MQTGKTWNRTSDVGRFSDWWVKTAVVSPDGKNLATGSEGVRLWSLKDGKLRHEQTLPGTTWAVSAIAFSPDGKRLVAGTGSGHFDPKDGQLLVWSLGKSPKVVARAAVAKAKDVTAVVVQRSGRIITADQTGKLVFWTPGTSGELVRAKELHAHGRGVRSLLSIRGGRLISTGNDGTVALWNAETGRLLKRWTFHTTAAVATVAPSGRHVAVGLGDGRVYVLRLSKE
jgi:WD40 repeat protein